MMSILFVWRAGVPAGAGGLIVVRMIVVSVGGIGFVNLCFASMRMHYKRQEVQYVSDALADCL